MQGESVAAMALKKESDSNAEEHGAEDARVESRFRSWESEGCQHRSWEHDEQYTESKVDGCVNDKKEMFRFHWIDG